MRAGPPRADPAPPAAVAVGAVPLVLGAMGFTGAGIAASSLAAKVMSAAAVANGGGVSAGGLVATLQSVGRCPELRGGLWGGEGGSGPGRDSARSLGLRGACPLPSSLVLCLPLSVPFLAPQ